jgi:stearoyl-CoA desaturase (delta-9 desaturase)
MYLACGLGITVGYHRMLTHRSFQAHPVVKFVLLALGTMSAMGPAYYPHQASRARG